MRAYLCSFDLCLLVETFASTFKADELFPQHEVFSVPGVKLSNATTARRSGGLILLVKKELAKYVTKINFEYDNMIAITIDKAILGTDTPVVLLGVYLPPSSSPYYADTEINNGVAMLEQCIMDILEESGDVNFILLGDFNSRTGSQNSHELDFDEFPLDIAHNDDVQEAVEANKRLSKDSVVNDFGKYLLNVCDAFGLSIVNGSIEYLCCGNFTYVSPNGCSVVDYFILSNSLLNLVSRMSVGERIESKHMPIELVLKCKTGSTPNKDVQTEIKIEKYVWDKERATEYINSITSPPLQGLLSEAADLVDQDIDESLSKLTDAILTAGSCMKKVITVGKKTAQRWFDKECYDGRKQLRKLLRKFTANATAENREGYTKKRREYKDLLRQKKISHRSQLVQSLHTNIKSPTEFWGKIKSCMGRKSASNNITPNEWFDHFNTLFNEPLAANTHPPPELEFPQEEDDMGINIDSLEGEITEGEVFKAIRAVKNNKAAGPDGIIGEFLKHAAVPLVPYLVKLFNKLFESGSYPKSWTEALIQPLYKKGDQNKPDNYRGISLLNILSKLYSSILNDRINAWIEDQRRISENQAGFRKKRSTIDHVFTMYAIIKKQLLYHKKLYVAFIDFKKAFDCVDRDKLWHVLKNAGIKSNSKMYGAITSIYNVVKAKVRTGNTHTDSFSCPRGVKQGEVLSPVLFSLFIEELSKEICAHGKHGIQLMPELVQILILMFADDVTLLSYSVCGLQTQLDILSQASSRLGLTVNLDKSNIVVFRNGGHLAQNEKWTYGREPMEVVNMYKYLGIVLSTRLSFSHSLSDMAIKAKKGVICILKLLWQLGEKSPSIFFKLFDAQIQPMLSYGAEIWGLEADMTIIERVHLFAIKRFLNVSIRTPNNLVYGETGRYPLRINAQLKSIKFWLRLLKMPTERIPRKTYNMLLALHENDKNTWVSSVCFLLYKYGFDEAWENQGVGNEKLFLNVLKTRLCDEFYSNWSNDMQTNERHTVYSSIKSRFGLAMYLNEIKHVQARNCLVRLRLGVSQILTHRLRFVKNLDEADMLCPLCGEARESEIHFLLVCPAYHDLREEYLSRKYYRMPTLSRLSLLMASENKQVMLNLSNFIRKAFYLRSLICDGQI